MLVGFLGIPGSGKTTIASSIFSDFKKNGIGTELIVEQARIHIAEKRFTKKVKPYSPLYLDDDDQRAIVQKQSLVEKYMKHSCGESTAIISDSSTINSFLYMSKDFRNDMIECGAFTSYLSRYDLLLYCHPVENFNLAEDSNRVHSEESIKVLSGEMEKLLTTIKAINSSVLFELAGTIEDRVSLAGHLILEKKLRIIEVSPE